MLRINLKSKSNFFTKQTVICFLFISYLGLTASAQRFNGGMLAGFTATQIDGDMLSGYDKPGVSGGFFINTKIKDFATKIEKADNINDTLTYAFHTFAQFEMKYIDKGARASSYHVMRLRYIEFPVFAGIVIKNRYFAEAGLYAGYLFYQKFQDETGLHSPPTPYHKVDFGGLIGAGYKINKHASVDFRYSYTFIRIYKIGDGNSPGPWYYRGHYNNVLNLNILYQF